MGYSTSFGGELEFDKPLTAEQVKTIQEFNEERHGGNTQPYAGVPGFWCQWTTDDEGKALFWDGGEKFYDYTEWLQYLIKKFFNPWGVKLSGTVNWYGEENEDMGQIVVKDNHVQVFVADVRFKEQ